jgi:hypothetical protein
VGRTPTWRTAPIAVLLVASALAALGPGGIGRPRPAGAAPAAFAVEQRVTSATPSSEEFFGDLVDIDGDRAVVYSNTAHQLTIYRHVGNAWPVEQTIPLGGEFVWALALDGTTLVTISTTVIRVFDVAVPGTAPTVLTNQPIADFVSSVAVDGSRFVVTNNGQGVVYERTAGTWAPGPGVLARPAGSTDTGFGPVDIEGDVIAVGGLTATYVFRRGPAAWVSERVLPVPVGPVSGTATGVALSGTTLIRGFNDFLKPGDLYLYASLGTAPEPPLHIVVPNSLESFDADDDDLVILDHSNTVLQYQRTGSSWDAGPSTFTDLSLVGSVAVSGESVIVGLPDAYVGELFNAGVVYFLTRGAPAVDPPGVPTGVAAVVGPGDGTATVTWQPPAGGGPVASYLVAAVSAGGAGAATTRSVVAPATSVVLRGLTDQTAYTVTVTAVNAIGSGAPSSPPTGFTTGGPATVASPFTVEDYTGDAPSDTVDIASATLSYDGDRITLTVRPVRVVDPLTDPLFRDLRGFYRVTFDPPTTPSGVSSSILIQHQLTSSGPSLAGELFIARFELDPACGVSPARVVAGAYQATLPVACLGTPAQLRFGVTMETATNGGDATPVSPFVLRGPARVDPPPLTPLRPDPGYWMVDAGGHVYAFGSAPHLGDAAGAVGDGVTAVDLEPTPSGHGYWILTSDGRVTARGDASGLGDATGLADGEQAVSISRTATGAGYWTFTDRGRALTFGDAVHHGDMAAVPLNGPVLDSIPTPTGNGYYMVASDGGVFTFGDARFAGSMGGQALNEPVLSLVPDPDGGGYWLVARDGGVFAFDAGFVGSIPAILQPGQHLNRPITGMIPYGDGYAMVAEDGGAFTFSTQPFLGSLGDHPPADPITSIATN